MFGWIISPNTAQMCFCKQFFIKDPIWLFGLDTNEELSKAMDKLNNNDSKVRLVWKNYYDDTSLSLNGSYITKKYTGFGQYEYEFLIPATYKPGIIKIGPFTICETIFDYLENKHIIGDYIYCRSNLNIFDSIIPNNTYSETTEFPNEAYEYKVNNNCVYSEEMWNKLISKK